MTDPVAPDLACYDLLAHNRRLIAAGHAPGRSRIIVNEPGFPEAVRRANEHLDRS